MKVYELLNDIKKDSKDYVAGGSPLPPIPKGVTKCKLNANENQLGPSPKVVEAMTKDLTDMYLYPLEQTNIAREAIASWQGFEPENIVLGSGSGSLICAIAELFINPGEEIIMCTPSYVTYTLLPSRYGAKLVEVPNKDFASDVHAMLDAVTDKTKLAVIVNPNNPTGAKVSNEDMCYFIEHLPEHVIAVVDEAYFEWVDDPNHMTMMKYVRENKNIIVLRTFSKLFGLAGLRLGYAVTTKEIQEHLKKMEFNYGPNRLVLKAVKVAIEDKEYITKSIKNNTDGRNYLQKELRALGFDVIESYTSFIYFAPHRNTKQLILDLNERGVMIRGFGETYVRVSIGRPEQNEQFINALKEIVNKE